MDYTTLGRTGLKVSVIGLGGGGHSRLGMKTNKTDEESAEIVKRAVELGINLIDTAEVYGTEHRVGAGLQTVNRQNIYISTKYSLYNETELKKPDHLEKSLDQSLARLNTEYVDIYHLHGVRLKDYDYAVQHLVPELIKLREKGKIRYIGITEAFAPDPSHLTLERAVDDDIWDVMMVGFNILNQSARRKVFQKTIEKNIGVLGMFAIRRALADPQALKELIGEMLDNGLLDDKSIDRNDPLSFLIREDGAINLQDAAYRYCRHEPAIHCMLTGTGNIRHLEDNIASANRVPLSESDVSRLNDLFAGIDSVSGN
jgi:aryl-alcohol dehydrogenase-like predicted oxidoreductase